MKNKKPIVINITGNIGCGKSTVTSIFNAIGIPVFNSDLISKFILTNKPDVVKKTSSFFGEEILKNNCIDTNLLGKIVFKNPEKLEFLNSVLHPEVRKAFAVFYKNCNSQFIIRETALLFETNLAKQNELIITVTCPLHERIKRVMERNQLSKKEILFREYKQLPEWEKAEKSHFIINNYNVALLPQIEIICSKLNNPFF